MLKLCLIKTDIFVLTDSKIKCVFVIRRLLVCAELVLFGLNFQNKFGSIVG